MPLKINFSDPVTYGSFTNSLKLRAVNLFDSYFYLGGRKCEVIKIKENNKFDVKFIKGTNPYKALKVASWFLTGGILPLIMFIGKLIARGLCDFSAENGQIESAWTKESQNKSVSSSEDPAIVINQDYLLTCNNETLGLDNALSEKNWGALLEANDMSYIVAMLHGLRQKGKRKLTKLDIEQKEFLLNRYKAIEDKLRADGWDSFTTLKGHTGSRNIDEDAACVLMINKAENIGFVAFHGSCNGSKFNPFSRTGDWGSNWDNSFRKASKCKLKHIPDYVRVHRGFGDNFASVQDVLLNQIDEKGKLFDLDKKPRWILTGHSKGAGVASIAIPIVRSHLNEKGLKGVLVGGVTISAPRAFDFEGAHWANRIVHPLNIVRLKVEGDPVTNVPRERKEFSHVGTLVLDTLEAVNKRNAQYQEAIVVTAGNNELLKRATKGFAKLKASLYNYMERIINYHYATSRDGMWCFEPKIVMQHSELIDGLEAGKKDRIEKCKPLPV